MYWIHIDQNKVLQTSSKEGDDYFRRKYADKFEQIHINYQAKRIKFLSTRFHMN